MVINTVGTGKKFDKEHSRIIDYQTNRLLADACLFRRVKKFILVSSTYVTRPETFTGHFLNTFTGGALGNKLEAENILRRSGLEYTIVRPGHLKGDHEFDMKESTIKNQPQEQVIVS